MKQIILLTLLTFSAVIYADESRYLFTNEIQRAEGGVWILDSDQKKIKYCWFLEGKSKDEVLCSEWSEI